MTNSDKRFTSQSGSAARHIVVLLALGMVCYFGVKAFYNRVDSSVSDRREQPLQPAVADARKTVQENIDETEVDKEAITRRNLFLSEKREGDSGLAALLNDGEKVQANLLLVGTIVETDGVNRAVVLDVEQKKQHLLKEGDMINGASVRRIDSGRLIISRQGRNELLDIAEAEKVRAATTKLIAPDKNDSLDRGPVTATNEQVEENEAEDSPVRVDLDKLGEMNDGLIIKGRTSDNI